MMTHRSESGEGKGDWELIPIDGTPPNPLSLRVPAGEAWRRDAVVWTTLAAELLGALVVGWALLRLSAGDRRSASSTGRPAAAEGVRRRSARLRNEKEE